MLCLHSNNSRIEENRGMVVKTERRVAGRLCRAENRTPVRVTKNPPTVNALCKYFSKTVQTTENAVLPKMRIMKIDIQTLNSRKPSTN